MKIYIKNMACESCKFVVQKAFEELNIALLKIDLGEVDTKTDVTHDQKIELNNKIRQVGLEVLENKQGVLIEKIRRVILDYVYKIEDRPVVKFSVYLSKELDHSYTYLSNFFSEVEATTIEQYIISLKIERIKELIITEEYTFSEIAEKLHYSSVGHLSNQFKKITGLSPSHFKTLKEKRRIAIQSL